MSNRVLKNEMARLINSGQAFTNPLGFVFNDVMDLFDNVLAASQLKSLVDTVTTRLLLPEIPIEVFDQMNEKLVDMNNALARAKTHTDELSGVILDGQKNINSVIQIVSVAQDDEVTCVLNENPLLGQAVSQSLNFLKDANKIATDTNATLNCLGNAFTDLSSNNPFTQVFGFMKNSKDVFTKAYTAKQKYEECKSFFENLNENQILDLMNPTEQQQYIDDKLESVGTTAEETTVSCEEQVDADEAAYIEAQKIVLAKAVTENIIALAGGSCSSQFIDKLRTPKFDAKYKELLDSI